MSVPLAPKNRRMVIIANPATRRNADRLLATIRDCAPPDVDLETHYTTAGSRIAEQLRAEIRDAWAVVAVGGDGTVAEVASAIEEGGPPLGIVPGGSTNIIARELGIPTNPLAAASLIFGPHHVKQIDMGVCGERRFLHMAGAGLDSRIFLATSSARKRQVGWVAYLLPAVRNLLQPPVRFTIVADGSTTEVVSPLVLVANGASILRPILPIYPDIRSDDGWLDVLIFTPSGPSRVLKTVGRFITRSLPRSPYVLRIRAKEVLLSSAPSIPIELDGDVVGMTPATIRIAPGALCVIMPEREPRSTQRR